MAASLALWEDHKNDIFSVLFEKKSIFNENLPLKIVPGSAFLDHLEAKILKIHLLGATRGGVFVDSIYVPVCPKKLYIRHWGGGKG